MKSVTIWLALSIIYISNISSSFAASAGHPAAAFFPDSSVKESTKEKSLRQAQKCNINAECSTLGPCYECNDRGYCEIDDCDFDDDFKVAAGIIIALAIIIPLIIIASIVACCCCCAGCAGHAYRQRKNNQGPQHIFVAPQQQQQQQQQQQHQQPQQHQAYDQEGNPIQVYYGAPPANLNLNDEKKSKVNITVTPDTPSAEASFSYDENGLPNAPPPYENVKF